MAKKIHKQPLEYYRAARLVKMHGVSCHRMSVRQKLQRLPIAGELIEVKELGTPDPWQAVKFMCINQSHTGEQIFLVSQDIH